jgi:hypothetical protein
MLVIPESGLELPEEPLPNRSRMVVRMDRKSGKLDVWDDQNLHNNSPHKD